MRQWIKRHALEVTLLLIILVMGGVLRWYDVGPSMHFGTDEGRDAFVVHELVTGQSLPLLGPAAPNNRPDFHLGPAFYYLLAPFYLVGQSAPESGAVAIALFSTLTIFLIYLVGRELWGWVAGLSAAGLYAASFFMVYYGRWIWNPNVVPFFMLLLVWFLVKLIREDNHQRTGRWIYGSAAMIGIVMQLHGTALLVVPVVVVVLLLWYRPAIWWWQYLIAGGVLLLVNAPAVWYDLTHRLANARGFLRVVTQSDSSASLSLLDRANRLYHLTENFFQESVARGVPGLVWMMLGLGTAVFVLAQIVRMIRTKKIPSAIAVIGVWFVVTMTIFIFYQEHIPPHYFAIIFPLPFLLAGWAVQSLWQPRAARIVLMGVVIALVSVQFWQSVQLLVDISPGGSRASSYPVRLDELRWVVAAVESTQTGEAVSYIAWPPEAYDRSFAYLFMLDGVRPEPSEHPRQVVVVDSLADIKAAKALGDVQSVDRRGALWLVTFAATIK